MSTEKKAPQLETGGASNSPDTSLHTVKITEFNGKKRNIVDETQVILRALHGLPELNKAWHPGPEKLWGDYEISHKIADNKYNTTINRYTGAWKAVICNNSQCDGNVVASGDDVVSYVEFRHQTTRIQAVKLLCFALKCPVPLIDDADEVTTFRPAGKGDAHV